MSDEYLLLSIKIDTRLKSRTFCSSDVHICHSSVSYPLDSGRKGHTRHKRTPSSSSPGTRSRFEILYLTWSSTRHSKHETNTTYCFLQFVVKFDRQEQVAAIHDQRHVTSQQSLAAIVPLVEIREHIKCSDCYLQSAGASRPADHRCFWSLINPAEAASFASPSGVILDRAMMHCFKLPC